MCGLVGEVTAHAGQLDGARLDRALATLAPRGPDATRTWLSPAGDAWLGHRRLSIIDLSDAGVQPMGSRDGRYQLVFNGEIYNYLELKAELADYPFQTASDSEVLLAAYATWGRGCLPRLRGMFAFALWDTWERRLLIVRDRFGVKPMYWHATAAGLVFASEIKALHAWGVPRAPDEATWATYLVTGLYDHGRETFWRDVDTLPAGHLLAWDAEHGVRVERWYDPAAATQVIDERPLDVVADELDEVIRRAVQLRFRADVPVGLCLSGGLDSSLLLGATRALFGREAPIHAFTFYTGDPAYDELPWVRAALGDGGQIAHAVQLTPADVPALAARVQAAQDEPFGGLPTLGMAKVHEAARDHGVVVLLDGNGMDEGWAGYDYYARAGTALAAPVVQGARSSPVRPECVRPELHAIARRFTPAAPFGDALRDLQYRDLTASKIPRAMRFADRVSMMYSRELREPFLDHQLVELGLRQPADRKIRDGVGKWLVRHVARRVLSDELREAPKRPVQTPQREWLRGSLAPWAREQIEAGLAWHGRAWLDADRVRAALTEFSAGGWDNSFPIWQWISLGLMSQVIR